LVFQNKVRFQIGVLSLANQGFGSAKFGSFSGGNFPSFGFSNIGSGFSFNKFRVKFSQVSIIGFKVFESSFGQQAVHFAKSVFHGLRFVWQSQVFKISFKSFSKGFNWFGLGCSARFISSGKSHGLQSQFFSIGFCKFSTLRSFNS
jgi:hypothetical protein